MDSTSPQDTRSVRRGADGQRSSRSVRLLARLRHTAGCRDCRDHYLRRRPDLRLELQRV